MKNKIEEFTLEFFDNLKCKIKEENGNFIVESVPKSFEDIFGKKSPYKVSFSKNKEGTEFAGEGSNLFNAINKYLENTGKTTLLKIDFDVDPKKEISKAVSFKNCSIENITKKHRNNYFSRFTFRTTFSSLSEINQIINEIYIHQGKIIKGNLSGYKILEGEPEEASTEHLEESYKIAKEELKNLIKEKTESISRSLKEKLEKEVEGIKEYYNNYLQEFGGDLNSSLEKIKEIELQIRLAEKNEAESLKVRLEKLRKNLLKMADDESKNKIIREQDSAIKGAIHKHSLSIENKLINTTIIYYPLFLFNLFIKGDGSGRFFEMSYDPLTKQISKLHCESCNKEISKLNLCSSGHISCEECLDKCEECRKSFCKKCLTRRCSICGKKMCKNCALTCLTCRKYVCKNDLRKDNVTGDEKCLNCLRPCTKCNQLTSPEYLKEASNGSKICQKCLGEEKRKKVIKKIFENE
ncbi:MAG: hypothetical protein WC494_03415 [Candidatus Pacearchaeota archaeon]